MKKVSFLLIALVIFHLCLFAQSAGAPAPDASKYSASAVWPLSHDFLQSAHSACDSEGADKIAQCFVAQMTTAGAPAEAVAFSHELYGQTGQFGVLGAIKDYSPVALAWVVFPLRESNKDALLVVNSKPPFIDLDNMKLLDKEALKKDPLFLQWQASAPKLDVFAADRSGGAPLVEHARVWPGPKSGDLQFVYSYPLLDGCATCAQSGFANYLWNFDSTGKFLGTKLLSVTRGVPPIQKHPYTPPKTGANPQGT